MNPEVARYLDAVPAERKVLVNSLHELIMRLYPSASVDLSYRMPTYKAGDGWVAVANQKRYVSLYTCGAHHLTRFKADHPGIKTGKGCINFKVSDEVPIGAVEEVVRHAMEHGKQNHAGGRGS